MLLCEEERRVAGSSRQVVLREDAFEEFRHSSQFRVKRRIIPPTSEPYLTLNLFTLVASLLQLHPLPFTLHHSLLRPVLAQQFNDLLIIPATFLLCYGHGRMAICGFGIDISTVGDKHFHHIRASG